MEVSLQQDERFPANKDTKCILPWIHQYGDLSGQYGLCCFTLNHDSNLFGKGLSPLEAFNSDPIRSARLEMLAGKQPKACKVCYDWEEEGIESHRQRMNQRFHNYSKLYSTTLDNGTITTPPIYLDFRFGNLCNFSCRMCGSYASSSWSKEDKHHGTLKQNAPNSYDPWTEDEKFWNDIEMIKKYIRVLYFAGGEPFVQEGHYKMLQFLVDNNCSKNIDLSYNTNLSYKGSFKGYDIEKLWSSFKSIDLWPSIEGFNKRAEYGRKGLDIELFKKNAERFSKYITSYSLVSSIYSITSNIELIKWIKIHKKSFNITNLVNPPYQSTTVLPTDLKKDIVQKYRLQISEIQDLSEHETKNIIGSLKYMNSRDDSHLQKRFKQINTRSDLYRNESFEAIFPELAEWYINI